MSCHVHTKLAIWSNFFVIFLFSLWPRSIVHLKASIILWFVGNGLHFFFYSSPLSSPPHCVCVCFPYYKNGPYFLCISLANREPFTDMIVVLLMVLRNREAAQSSLCCPHQLRSCVCECAWGLCEKGHVPGMDCLSERHMVLRLSGRAKEPGC